MDTGIAFHATVLILGVGLSIKSLETLHLLAEYGRRGLLDYRIAGSDAGLSGRFAPQLERLYSMRGVALLCMLSLAAYLGLWLIEPGDAGYRVVLVAFVGANAAMYYRQAFGLDGADQMALLILFTTLLCVVPFDDGRIRAIGLWFIGLQVALSYLVSGVAKLQSPEWRRGLAIRGILSTYTYGTGATRRVVTRSRVLSLPLAWSVILVEIALPFGLLLPPRGVLLTIAIGLALHVSIAIVMGLNDFVWSFAAAYPAFYFVGTRL